MYISHFIIGKISIKFLSVFVVKKLTKIIKYLNEKFRKILAKFRKKYLQNI